MSKWIVGIGLLIAAMVVFYLVQQGIITWQPLTILAAVIAAPFKFVMGLFGDEGKIRKGHEEERAREAEWTQTLEKQIADRDQRIAQLNDQLSAMNAKIAALEHERGAVSEAVGRMSTSEKQRLAQELFGS